MCLGIEESFSFQLLYETVQKSYNTKMVLVLLLRKLTSSSEWHLSQISPQRPTVSEISWQSASCDDDC